MSKEFFCKVTVEETGRDITYLIERFKYEDCTDKDDMLTISVFNDHSIDAADAKDLQKGYHLKFFWGYKGGRQSKVHVARISDNDTMYALRNTTTIKALDQGVVMKKNSSDRVWKDMSIDEIINDLANIHGLRVKKNYINLDTPLVSFIKTNLNLDGFTKKITFYPQAGKNDFELIQELVMKATNGKMIAYVKDKNLVIAHKAYTKKSSVTINIGSSDVIQFHPQVKDTSNDAEATETELVSVDMEKKEVVKSGANADAPKTGDYSLKFNENGDPVNAKPITNKGWAQFIPSQVKKKITSPEQDPETLTNEATNTQQGAEAGLMTASLTMVGDPAYEADSIITISGRVAKRHSGNYFTKSVTHDGQPGSAYKCSFELEKNGTAAPAKKDAEANDTVNKTTGPEQAKKTVTVALYDEFARKVQ